MANKRKIDCTPEEWQAHLAKVRAWRNSPENIERQRQRRKQYAARPEVKAKRKAYDARPEQVKRRRANAKSPQAKRKAELRRKARWTEILANQRRRRTGFTQELIAKLVRHQRNRCGVCRRSFAEEPKICADHCHEKRTPRGLLCHKCNSVEGLMRATGLSPEQFLGRLAKYLRHPPAHRFVS